VPLRFDIPPGRINKFQPRRDLEGWATLILAMVEGRYKGSPAISVDSGPVSLAGSVFPRYGQAKAALDQMGARRGERNGRVQQ